MGFRTLVVALLLSACSRVSLHHPATAQDAADSTYMVTIFQDGRELGTGTAWVYGREDGHTQILTAGHVCPLLPGLITYTLTGQGNTVTVAFELYRADDPDLCMLQADVTGYPMGLADVMPDYGEGLMVVGAPHGLYGNGVAPVYHSYYAGAGYATGSTIAGLSGSAVISARGVVGVLVEGFFTADLYHMVTLDELKAFIHVSS